MPDLQQVTTDIVHDIEKPLKFITKAAKVLDVAINNQPELKTMLTTLLAKAEALVADGIADFETKGENLTLDGQSLVDLTALIDYLRDATIPEIESIYGQLGADLD